METQEITVCCAQCARSVRATELKTKDTGHRRNSLVNMFNDTIIKASLGAAV